MREQVGISGRVTLTLRDRSSGIELEQVHKNLITIEGRRLLGGLLAGTTDALDGLQMAVGSGSKEAETGDKGLVKELDRRPAEEPLVKVADDGSNVVVRIKASFPGERGMAVQELREAGILVPRSSGEPVLFNRVVFPVVSRGEGLDLALTWEIVF